MAAAKDLPQLSLTDALDLTMLVARKNPRCLERMAARWLLRLLEEDPAMTIQEAALAASSLIALAALATWRPRRRSRPWLKERLAAAAQAA